MVAARARAAAGQRREVPRHAMLILTARLQVVSTRHVLVARPWPPLAPERMLATRRPALKPVRPQQAQSPREQVPEPLPRAPPQARLPRPCARVHYEAGCRSRRSGWRCTSMSSGRRPAGTSYRNRRRRPRNARP